MFILPLLLPLALYATPLTPPAEIPARIANLCAGGDCGPRAIELSAAYDQLADFTPPGPNETYAGLCEMVGRSVFGGQAYKLVQLTPLNGRVYYDGSFSGPVRDAYTGLPNVPRWESMTTADIRQHTRETLGDAKWELHRGANFAFVDTRTREGAEQFIAWLRSDPSGEHAIAMGYFSFTSAFICDLRRRPL